MSTVVISGANRGLGLEFVRQYLQEGWHVISLCRDLESATELSALSAGTDKLDIYEADVADFDLVRKLSDCVGDRPIDLLINNAGVFGPKPGSSGDLRQNFGHIAPDTLTEVFRVNAVAPLIMTEVFLDQILASEQKKIVTISSSLGSIEETEGGYYGYRMSKAAVNMAMANLAKEITSRGAIVSVLNPGWVKTDMGGEEAEITPSDSIRSMRTIIAGLSGEQSGSFIDFDGRIIPW